MRLITILTPCYNEEANVEETYRQVKGLFVYLGKYRYEHLFIDNASTDGTQAILRRLARQDGNVKVIFNSRNFGQIRSPHHGLLQAQGDAVIPVVADLQDPLDVVPLFLRHWEEGRKIVVGIKRASEESPLLFACRRFYYRLVGRLSSVELVPDFHGFGLYDRDVIEAIRQMDDPYPYARGMIAEIGFEPARVEYDQRQRRRGATKNNFYSLYDMAMLGVTNYSKLPLRLATMLGFLLSALFLLVGVGYLIAKLVFWDRFSLGTAPLLVGLFLFGSIQLFFIGILGEYIGAIHTQVLRRPLVIERERLNFDAPPAPAVRAGVASPPLQWEKAA
jgi:glycosyltransferase involved in cell wall biosynthesis